MAYGGYTGPIYGNNYGPQQNYGQQQNYVPQQNYNPQQMVVPQPQPVQQNQLQIQNGGFMVVPSEDMARTYPVAPGNCVTFKIEGKPIVMEKSMGFSQLEAPRIDRYRLVREEDAPNDAERPQNELKTSEPDSKLIDVIKDEIKDIWSEINKLKDQMEEDKEGA
jgi:hypothetical protein